MNPLAESGSPQAGALQRALAPFAFEQPETPGLQLASCSMGAAAGVLSRYRYDGSPEYADVLAGAATTWLKASLARDGHACMEVSRCAGVARVAYGNPSLLAANVPEAAFVAYPESLRAAPAGSPAAHSKDPCTAQAASWAALGMHAVVAGQPASCPWDSLLTPGVVEGDFCVQLHTLSLPEAWLRDRASFLQAAADAASAQLATMNRGDLTRAVANPVASNIRRRADEERERLLSSGEQARFFMAAGAANKRDLHTICAILLGCMAATDEEGRLAPERFSLRVSDNSQARAQVVPVNAVAVAAVPPTRATAGLTVVNAEVGAAAHRAFATTGTSAAGEILLGSYEHGGQARLPLSLLAQHVLVCGMPGTGKTTLVANLARQLASCGVTVCVLEPAKVEYAQLLNAFEVLGDDGRAKPLRLNPLQADPGIKVSLHLQDLSTCLISALGLGEQPLPLHLDQLLRRVYRESGVDVGAPFDGQWPSPREFLAEVDSYIREQTFSGKEITANVRGVFALRGRYLCSQPAFLTRDGLTSPRLLARSRIVQLSDLGDEHGALAGMLLLAKLVRFSRSLGTRKLHTVVILEEAHTLLESRPGECNLFARLYEKALAELRASGIGFITVEQRSSLLPAGVLANSVTKVAFGCLHGDDRQATGRAMGLSDYQMRRLGGLDLGQAIVTTMGSQGADLVNTKSTQWKGATSWTK